MNSIELSSPEKLQLLLNQWCDFEIFQDLECSFKNILNPERFQNHTIGSKVIAIFLDWAKRLFQ